MTADRISPWRGLGWLTLSAVGSWVMLLGCKLMMWADDRANAARQRRSVTS